MEKQKKKTALIVYTVVFYAIWTAFELIVKDSLNLAIKNEILCQFVKSGIIKNLVWTLPAIALIRRFKSEVYITLKEMFTTKIRFQHYLPVFLIFTVVVLAVSILEKGKLNVAESFGAEEIIIVLFVGLTEEMVFRGWLLNSTIREDKKWFSIILNAAMFLFIHFPTWIHTGTFISNFVSFQFLGIIALSLVFSCTFLKSKNILVPITLHMYYDLLVFMFI